jgi:hypothetical protein
MAKLLPAKVSVIPMTVATLVDGCDRRNEAQGVPSEKTGVPTRDWALNGGAATGEFGMSAPPALQGTTMVEAAPTGEPTMPYVGTMNAT